MIIYKSFTFDSAHFLPNVPPHHKCRNIHGHTYHLTVYFEGEVTTPEGWVLDFALIKNAVKPIVDQLDHTILNEVPGLENPTAENLARYLLEEICPTLLKPMNVRAIKVVVWERGEACCEASTAESADDRSSLARGHGSVSLP